MSIAIGDLLVMFSDGILEVRDNNGRIFGQDGINEVVLRNRGQSPDKIADAIMEAVAQHTGLMQPDDDQTLVVVLIEE